MTILSLYIFLGVSFLIVPTETKWIEGTIKTESDWEFLTRFCFLTQQGTLSYEFKYPVEYGAQDLLLYYDTPGQWDSVYLRGKNCSESMSVLNPESNQIITLSTRGSGTSAFSGCEVVNTGIKPWFHCRSRRSFKSSRERWWYMAIARCGPPSGQVKGLYLEYKVHMTNGDDLLHREFSADEFYILPVDITFFLMYIIICILSLICAAVLRRRQLFHTTYKLYLASIFIWTLHLLLKVIAWGYYGTTGWEARPLEVTGRILQMASTIVFILMLILMAKGFTITRGRLTRISTIKITAFFNAFVVVIVVLFIWEGLLFDPGLVLYYYESPPGYGIVSMHLLGWLWFLYATVFTLKHSSSQNQFYIPFFAFYTLWFWAGPIIVLIAMFAMAKWSREKTVNGVEQFVGFWGHIFFLALTRPNAANKNFPYHVRTSQIGFLDTADLEKKNNPYVVSSRVAFSGSGPNLEFFITSKTSDSGGHGDNAFFPPIATDMAVSKESQGPKLKYVGQNIPSVDNNNEGVITVINPNNSINNNNTFSGNTAALTPSEHHSLTHDLNPGMTTLAPLRGARLPPLFPSAPPAGGLPLVRPQ
ncbi:unnamed protein product [Lymnaea stagnalis]|uniref:Intimal thickness related receptor IRP domain-containing protein n=1 Tax=Lymnaea stagnalis TaxID=6523 RepID=A0AAV2HKV1_LYMST